MGLWYSWSRRGWFGGTIMEYTLSDSLMLSLLTRLTDARTYAILQPEFCNRVAVNVV